MRMPSQSSALALVGAMTVCQPANGQAQAQSAPSTSGLSTTKESGWSGYSSGGERGGVVQVISDADVQAELNLNNDQQQRVGDILRQVKSIEDGFFEDFRRAHQEGSDNGGSRGVDQSKRYEEA